MVAYGWTLCVTIIIQIIIVIYQKIRTALVPATIIVKNNKNNSPQESAILDNTTKTQTLDWASVRGFRQGFTVKNSFPTVVPIQLLDRKPVNPKPQTLFLNPKPQTLLSANIFSDLREGSWSGLRVAQSPQ